MANLTIPEGYRVSITTWENDADHYLTQVIEGLCLGDARFYVRFAQQFVSKNSSSMGYGSYKGLGNQDFDLLAVVQAIKRAAKDLEGMSAELSDQLVELVLSLDPDVHDDHLADQIDDIQEFMMSVLGYTVSYDWGFMRVFSSYEIHWVGAPVLIEDITSKITI